ncbi:MAG: DUF1194 domain-containing protein [Proteobacteria bacterium]|nr:DUF1194 domain-containing protein [Pseudomonadota bacterium]
MSTGTPVRALLAALALAALAPAPARATDIKVDLELVLAVDVSGSIDAEEGRLQRDGYIQAIANPRVVKAIQSGFHRRIALTYIEWAGFAFQQTVVGWRLIEDEASAHAFASALVEAPIGSERRTSISGAIDYAVKLFDNNGFEGTRRVIDISGDGMNNAGRMVTDARDEALAKGLTINGLPIVNGRPGPGGWAQPPGLERYYDTHVIGGPGAFMIVASSFEDFARAILQKMLREIVGDPPPGSLALAAEAGTERASR